MGLEGIAKVVSELLGELTFDDLLLPCALTAVDLDTGQPVQLQEGRVVDAVLATVAIPGIFPPQRWGNYTLVDGGVLNPVPISAAREISLMRVCPLWQLCCLNPSTRGSTYRLETWVQHRMALP